MAHTLHFTTEHGLSLISLLWLHQPVLGNSSQRCRFLSFVFMHLLAGDCLTTQLIAKTPRYWILATTNSHLLSQAVTHFWLRTKLELELSDDWQFTAKQFVLAPSPLRITSRDFFDWTLAVIVLLAFVKYTYCTYSMLLKILNFTIYESSISPGFAKQISVLLMVQWQHSHLNACKLDHHQNRLLGSVHGIWPWHRPHRKPSPTRVLLLLCECLLPQKCVYRVVL
jgi:hypothetical protein